MITTRQETLITNVSDGTAITSTTAASCIPTGAVITLPPSYWYPGRTLRITASGNITCAATAPGTARFDVRLGAIVVFNTLDAQLNTLGRTDSNWDLTIELTCRTIGSGTSATLVGVARFTSDAIVGAPLPQDGGNAVLILPLGGVQTGTGFDSTSSATLDLFFTQSVDTGSMTLRQYRVEALN